MIRIACAPVMLLLVTAGAARGELWWTEYRADTGLFPEECGWLHVASDPPAQRWIEDGKLFIDSRAALGIGDVYGQRPTGLMMPDPGELFTFRFRIKVDYVDLGTDPGFVVETDDNYMVSFGLDTHRIVDTFHTANWTTFEPNVFHVFTLQSSDMRTYRLYIDDQFAFQGPFLYVFEGGAEIAWGDLSTGSSLAEWDYVEAGVTPEAQPGDLNCDGTVNFGDINPFVLALTSSGGYQQQYPNCSIMLADINGDGHITFTDINPFVALISGQ